MAERAATLPTRYRLPSVLRLSCSRTVVELKVFFRSPEAVAFTFALPILFLILFSSVFSGDIDAGDGRKLPFPQYFLPGIIASGVLSTTFANLAMAISFEQTEGLLKRLAGTPLPRSAFFAGKLGMSVILAVIQTALMLVIGVVAYGIDLPAGPDRWGVFLGVLAMSAAIGAVLGVAYTRLIKNGRQAAAIVQPPFLILQFISGVYFRWADVPGWLQGVATVFPVRWMAQGFRYAFLPDWMGQYEYGDSWGWERPVLVLAAWLAGGFVLALLFFRWDRGSDR